MDRLNPEPLKSPTERDWLQVVLNLHGYFERPLRLAQDVFAIDTAAAPAQLTTGDERTVEHQRIWLGFLSLWHVDVDSYGDLIRRLPEESLELFETYYEDVMDLLGRQRELIHARRAELGIDHGFIPVDGSPFPEPMSASHSDA
jgi:hypothetical protein